VLLVGCDPDDPTRRAIDQIKNNLAEHGESVGFTFRDGCFQWTGVSELTAERILSAVHTKSGKATVSDAKAFLLEVLSEGPKPSNEIKKEADEYGIAGMTLRRAKQSLGVLSCKEGQPRRASDGYASCRKYPKVLKSLWKMLKKVGLSIFEQVTLINSLHLIT
jgi:hypothetical protein